ncbi:MAG: histidinol-phosphate transaminase [Actinomycetaceae bacterium]|nr:histidinol-phosphate transaminase [Actinomycetaceae bacterium]
MDELALPLRPELAGIEPYGAPQLDVACRLNVNENPYPPSEQMVAAIVAAVGEAARGLNRYPDRDARQLRADLAAYLAREAGVALSADHVWAANGSNEIMLHLLQAFGGAGRTLAATTPSYSMYPEYARDTGTAYRACPRRKDFSVDVAALEEMIDAVSPSLLVIPSPNNPTGTALDLSDAAALAEATRRAGPQGSDCLFVIDEAYAEFRREGTPSALELVRRYPHVVVTRTLSKAFGMAGLRLGYLAAHPSIVDALAVVRLPYHLSAITQAAARAALSHADAQLDQVARLRHRRDELARYLVTQGFDVVDSDANFILFGRFRDRHAVFSQLLERGILVREVGPQGYLRVSIGTGSETEAFKRALTEVTS